ncbi:MAG: NtaA/DmoA family FMN-dependent monooxygenase [Acidimicrobiia bacterium]
MFHLGWFLGSGYSLQGTWNTLGEVQNRDGTSGVWNGTNGYDWWKPDMFVDLAASLERAGFDYILIEDTTSIDDTHGGSMESTLKHAIQVPKNDPLPLVPLMTQRTKHIGIIPTISSTFYQPYTAARVLATLDHMTEGRVGVNVVTSVNEAAALLHGLEAHPEHDLRYEMATEWIELLKELWGSWEPDAVVVDEERNVFADHRKVHKVDHQGRFFKCHGALNIPAGPQGWPVIAQAGASPAGRQLSATHCDTMIGQSGNIEHMKAFRNDIRERMVALGRKPDECKVLFMANPILGETDEEALERDFRYRVAAATPDQIEKTLWTMSYSSGGSVDYGALDLDAPMPETAGNGQMSVIAKYLANSGGGTKTLRELVVPTQEKVRPGEHNFIGSPDTVAGQMQEVMEEVGGDGFLIGNTMTRRSIAEVADGLAPALRRRGLIRTGYSYDTFRENLLEY